MSILFPSFWLLVSSPQSHFWTDTPFLWSLIFILHRHLFISSVISIFFIPICPPPPLTNCSSISAHTHTVCAYTHITLIITMFVILSYTALQKLPQSIQCAVFQITFVSGGAFWPTVTYCSAQELHVCVCAWVWVCKTINSSFQPLIHPCMFILTLHFGEI